MAVCLPTESLAKAPTPSASTAPQAAPHAAAAGDAPRVRLSRNTIDSLFRILCAPPEGEVADLGAARDELRNVFAPARQFATTLPQNEGRAPLTILCGGAVNALPWELLFDEAVVRAPTLASLVASDAMREPGGPPLYLVPYYSDSAAQGDKGAAAFEARKEWVALGVRTDLRLALAMPSGARVLANELLPTPLVKWGKKQPKGGDKKALPLVSYVDVAAIEHCTDLGYVLDVQSASQPVFVASLTDLVYPTEALQFLIASHCPLLCVPEARVRNVLTRLTAQQERLLKGNPRALKTNKELASLLLAAANQSAAEDVVPVAIINLPR